MGVILVLFLFLVLRRSLIDTNAACRRTQHHFWRWQASCAPWRRPRRRSPSPKLRDVKSGSELPKDLTPDRIRKLCQMHVPGWSQVPRQAQIRINMTFNDASEYGDERLRDSKLREALLAAGFQEKDIDRVQERLVYLDSDGRRRDELDEEKESENISFPMNIDAIYKKDTFECNELTVGLSNRNYKVVAGLDSGPKAVLFRAYGSSKSELYDAELELRLVHMLASYDCGPKVYATGEAWRIEEWHTGRPLETSSMRNPSIMVQVAAQLARLHGLSSREDFPEDIKAMPPATRERMKHWHCERAARRWQKANPTKELRVDVAALVREAAWLRELQAQEAGKCPAGCGMDVVFAHWDAQENNILCTNYGIRFIDFEYAGMEHQAFDLAGYFLECTIDYTATEYPFFSINMENYPTVAEQRLFCSVYLSEYLNERVHGDDPAVDDLLRVVERFTLIQNYLWTNWAVVRASQSSSEGSFDYLAYGRSRWEMYLQFKKQYLARSS